jgi:hypothetical protein
MNGRQVFRFHIGPVQGFIAQARRTRDLWAGSFLLSWLAAQAMAAVRKQQFTIELHADGRMGGDFRLEPGSPRNPRTA